MVVWTASVVPIIIVLLYDDAALVVLVGIIEVEVVIEVVVL